MGVESNPRYGRFKKVLFLVNRERFFLKKKIDILETIRYLHYHADEAERSSLGPAIYFPKISYPACVAKSINSVAESSSARGEERRGLIAQNSSSVLKYLCQRRK